MHWSYCSLDLFLLNWEAQLCICTVECRYNMVQYNMIWHTSPWWLMENINEKLNPQNTPHSLPVRILDIDSVTMALHRTNSVIRDLQTLSHCLTSSFRIGSSLFQVMACCLLRAKPLLQPVLPYCQLDCWEYNSLKFESTFIWKKKNIANVVCQMTSILFRP